jgi:DNA-binding transcriptional ArsR family regulator
MGREDGPVSVTIDVTGLTSGDYLFAPSALGELGSALHLLAEPNHHPTRSGWVAAVTAAVDPGLLDRVIDMDYLWRTSRADIFLPSDPRVDLAAELDAVDQLDDETWVGAALITSSCGTVALHRDLGSPLADVRARELARERAASRGPRQSAFVDFVLDHPADARQAVRRLLEDCNREFFDQAWNRIVVDLAADARLKRDLLGTYGLGRALSAVSPAVTLNESGNRIVVDKLQDNGTSAVGAGVTFLPSAFGHPHLMVVHAPGWSPVIQYPAASTALADVVGIEEVQSRLRALDHPTRLRLARSLLRGQQTTASLAETWNLTPPEVSRHLATLRDAGIVTSTRRGRYVLYELDQEAVARFGLDLLEALLR